jgi:hypothetical protein
MFKLDYIIFQKKKEEKKEKVEDNNLFSAQETHLLK